MLESLKNRIKTSKLTKTEKLIADYFQEKESKLYFMTSRDIAAELKVSDTSIIRFVKSLGFENFTEFKDSLKENISNKIITPNEKLNRNKLLLESEKMMDIFLDNIESNISETFSKNSIESLNTVSEVLLQSQKKYVIGFKSTSGFAAFFGLRLGFVMEGVKTYSRNSSELLKDIVDIKEGDCLFIVAYPKYSKTYNLLIKIAKKAKAKIIVLTDKATSPVIKDSDITLFINISGISYFNSMVATQALLEYFLTDLSRKIGNKGNERLALINSYLDENL
ncbi:MAG: MurR/RpiR family transcriptional regulator [Cetobacterium sp.]|uniref:MurR/RpiR family transcriptional regulator n=1 Tax=unclassified Cetobacterium TaxID=2630983 RepID=UPI00163C4B0D|nr:MurR/RpiR family transcriptional regulator [Cetobacterium sp. 2A]MBC2855982.1 MurR/RpiR family transcriptional regulator [Cetobacterium sp. 2A]